MSSASSGRGSELIVQDDGYLGHVGLFYVPIWKSISTDVHAYALRKLAVDKYGNVLISMDNIAPHI